jgi:hypothetical protein
MSGLPRWFSRMALACSGFSLTSPGRASYRATNACSASVDEVLGFLLGAMGDVTADPVRPETKQETTPRRLPFLTYPIRVWTYGAPAVGGDD